eukprot:TRINITY_DN10763_c0_g1_i1.p2 TRINITY_DN10763_c0_g1~~TRINITY_DN10763_c0_g1_i1.p2  ORF type:complete len:104 (+),score=16.38 TRINITY_DN10763_c0_g1_i1:144-455(+)
MDHLVLILGFVFVVPLIAVHILLIFLLIRNKEEYLVKSSSFGLLLLMTAAITLSTVVLSGLILLGVYKGEYVGRLSKEGWMLVLLAFSELVALPVAGSTYIGR